jgi:hypothetical protein
MLTRNKMLLISAILALFLGTAIFQLTGCSRNNVALTVFSEIDGRILTQAYADYEDLK